MTRFVPLLAFALLAACGLADDERDGKNKRVYITFADPAFEAYCLEHFDIDHDGRISRYEAQRVLKMDCPDRGIAHMWEIGEFSRLERLDCSGNDLTQLDLRKCTLLQTLDCSRNRIASLDLDGLRALLELNCADNALTLLDLKSAGALRLLDCSGNRLVTLDLRPCSDRLKADAGGNPPLTTVYCRASQSVSADGHTEIIVR